jgi:hypothetical protein
MAKQSKKRRAWTAAEVRELKSWAKKKTAASKISKKLRRTEYVLRSPAKGERSIEEWSKAYD